MKKLEFENKILEEIEKLRKEIGKISMVVESRVIGFEKPTREEIKAIRNFEKKRKEGKLKLVSLSKLK
ncbi:MAG: hypothetical protein QMD14_04080 [Candidatus Aenigmarchaeota archaeon]|nr:hypothetical protein [Candidatus Aenigmarchaeota archaeon]